MNSTQNKLDTGLPQAAALMTYAASLPPIIATIFLWPRPADFGVDAKTFLLLYGGALLTFFGGVRWGVWRCRSFFWTITEFDF